MKSTAALISATFCLLIWGHVSSAQASDSIQSVSSVPASQSARIAQDIQAMRSMSFAQSDPELAKLLELSDLQDNPTQLTADTLLNWMQARVHYFIDENFSLADNMSVQQTNYTFPNPTLLPNETSSDASSSVFLSDDSASTVQVMENIGLPIYTSGKKQKALLQINLPGIEKVTITSPRVGIVKLSSGLFSQLSDDPSLSLDSKPYVAYRLSILFHEARHSDGNGTSLGFYHALCPSGTYAGKAACDRNLNGPYQIQAKFLSSLIASCTDCSDGDTQAMQVIEADAASRQITGQEQSSSDPALSALQTQLATCQLMQSLNAQASAGENCSDLQSLQDQIAKLQSASAQSPSTWWDATPEGTFVTP